MINKDGSISAYQWRLKKLIHRNYINKGCQMLCITPTLNLTYILAGDTNGNISVWLKDSGALLSVMKAHYGGINCINCTSDNTGLISGGQDGIT
eukprot:UN04373